MDALVRLTWAEAHFAAMVGVSRQLKAMQAGKSDRFGAEEMDGWGIHIEGAAAEMCVAKWLGRFWSPSVNTFRAPDLEGGIQVRLRSRHEYELIVRPTDDDTHRFVHVTGEIPNFRIRGWITGSDAKREEWEQTHGGRPKAWFVPNDGLNPLESIF